MAVVDSLNVNLPEARVIDSDFDGHWVDPTTNGYHWLLKTTEAPLFADSFESENKPTKTLLRAEMAFLNESSGTLTFNGDHEWDSGHSSIQRA